MARGGGACYTLALLRHSRREETRGMTLTIAPPTQFLLEAPTTYGGADSNAGAPAVSVVIPCMNEEDGLPHLRERLWPVLPALEREAGGEAEVILVDDGSTDRTRARMEETFAGERRVRILAHERNRGLGAAVRTGLLAARGAIVCTMDSDCTYDPRLLPALVRLVRRGGADVATGSPYHPLGGVENVPPWRLLLSRALSAIYASVVRGRLYTYTSMFRAYRAAAMHGLAPESDGFLGMADVLVRGLERGLIVKELPAVLRRRRYGVSKIATLRVIRQHLRFLWRVLGVRLRGERLA